MRVAHGRRQVSAKIALFTLRWCCGWCDLSFVWLWEDGYLGACRLVVVLLLVSCCLL